MREAASGSAVGSRGLKCYGKVKEEGTMEGECNYAKVEVKGCDLRNDGARRAEKGCR